MKTGSADLLIEISDCFVFLLKGKDEWKIIWKDKALVATYKMCKLLV